MARDDIPDDDREVVEGSLLRATFDRLGALAGELKSFGISLRGASLVGKYPDTRLVIQARDQSTGAEGTMTFNVWPDLVGGGEPPEVGAGIIAVNIDEHLWEWAEPSQE